MRSLLPPAPLAFLVGLMSPFMMSVAVCSAAATDAMPAADTWHIDSGPTDPGHYFGETVANGMIGIRSAPAPFAVAQILLQGA